jgi:hypothetical protein
LRYTSVLESRAASPRLPARVTSSLRAAQVGADAEVVHLDAPGVALAGEWRARAEPVEETVFSAPAGEVRWRCLQPHSRATLRLAGETLAGDGYFEHLLVTVPPWELPLRELRWGRFHGGDHVAVWIDWRGPFERRLGLHDGALVVPDAGDTLVSLGDRARLELLDSQVLRTGALGTTALRGIPVLGESLPARMLAVEETKWLSRSRLVSPEGETTEGWSIHEVVRWP